MAINATNAEYDASAGAWSRARDVIAGEDAIKAAGQRYLPRLECQSDEEYDAYKERAAFFNATARTAEGYLGLLFRRSPFVKAAGSGERGAGSAERGAEGGEKRTSNIQRPTSNIQRGKSALERAMGEFGNDVDLMGTALADYARKVSREVIHVGRAGTLIDWCACRTGHDESPDGRGEDRVYATLYQAEQILNWRVQRVGGRNVLGMVVLAEQVELPTSNAEHPTSNQEDGDGFEAEVVEQVRVVRLIKRPTPKCEPHGPPHPTSNQEMQCVVEIWRPIKKGKKDTISSRQRRDAGRWELVDRRVPLRRGKPLPLIPFVFHGPNHAGPEVDKLPLADIIAVNLDHYRLHAEYRHGMHFTALPTAWVSGFDKNATLKIGSSAAWVTETVGATAGFLEYTGQGLSTFERAMDRDEHAMAVLGARLLETQKRVGEAAEAIELKQSGENSILGTLASSVGMSLTQVLRWAHWWNSIEALPEDIGKEQALVEINTDYSTRGLTATEITAVVSAWQNGALSRDSMMDIFRRGEVLPEGRTNEEEAGLIKGERPTSNAEHPTSNGEEKRKAETAKSAEGAKASIRYPRLKNEA